MENIAVVTGASRGIGRGIAIALDAARYRVFAVGRNVAGAELPGRIRKLPCDLTDRTAIAGLFQAVTAETGGPSLLVNAAWGGYERMVEDGVFTWPRPFWQQPEHRWDSMMLAGVRAAYDCSCQAITPMLARGSGLIVHLSSWAAQKHIGNVLYGMSKAATDKMAADMAAELRPHGVSVVSLYPGLVRTEAVLEAARAGWLDLSNSESPEFIGRVIAALDADPDRLALSGSVQVAAALARRYGVVDIDGRNPEPLDLAAV